MTTTEDIPYRDRAWVLRAIGVACFLAGLAAAYIGPIELSVFAAFSEGGRFHYPGFGFGSFMFANIAAQTAAYYVAAAVLIPVGYGHLALRRWIRPLTLAGLYAWLVLGIPLLLFGVFATFSVKAMPDTVAWGLVVVMALSYALLPWLAIRFYRGSNVRYTLASRSPDPAPLEQIPISLLVVVILFAFGIAALHSLILLNGLYPAFGTLWNDRQGVQAIGATALAMAILAWGLVRRRAWAWWGATLFSAALALSIALTLVPMSWSEILDALAFPATERAWLDGIPLHGGYLAVLAGGPMLATVGILLAGRRGIPRGRAGWLPLL
jgi:hypothetical protein